MYDSLYEPFLDDVEVVVHADHPTLNRRAAELLAAGERIDVLSTHGKYAPSQAQWLRPLNGLVDTTALAPKAVDLCSFNGDLLCAPRNIDVRTLWWRTDRIRPAPRRGEAWSAATRCSGSPVASRACSGCSSSWSSARRAAVRRRARTDHDRPALESAVET